MTIIKIVFMIYLFYCALIACISCFKTNKMLNERLKRRIIDKEKKDKPEMRDSILKRG